MKENKISGIYCIYKQWDLIWLSNKLKQQKNSMDYFKFETLLHSIFTHDQCLKILENINCDRKVIVDFDSVKASVVSEKDEPFEKYMEKFFEPQYIQDTINNPENYIQEVTRPDIRRI